MDVVQCNAPSLDGILAHALGPSCRLRISPALPLACLLACPWWPFWWPAVFAACQLGTIFARQRACQYARLPRWGIATMLVPTNQYAALQHVSVRSLGVVQRSI